jgi:hypothetical protein
LATSKWLGSGRALGVDAWPFLWYKNEHVADTASIFILAANTAEALTRSMP